MPKRIALVGIPLLSETSLDHIMMVEPTKLWGWLNPVLPYESGGRTAVSNIPYVVDVRQPREYSKGHIVEANSIPLPQILSDEIKLPPDKQIVIVCRTGRRSRRAAAALQHIGCLNVQILQGGMLAWEAAGLLEAVDY